MSENMIPELLRTILDTRDRLEGNRAYIDRQIADMKRAMDLMNARLDKLEQEDGTLRRCDIRSQNNYTECEELKCRVDKHAVCLENVDNRVAEYAERLDEASATRKALIEHADKQDKEIALLSKSVSNWEKGIERFYQAESVMDALKNGHSALTEQLSEAVRFGDQLNQVCGDLQRDVAKLQSDIVKLQKAKPNQTLARRITESQNEFEERITKATTSIKGRIATHDAEIHQVAAKAAAAQARCTKLEQTKRDNDAELEALKVWMVRSAKRLDDFGNMLAKLTGTQPVEKAVSLQDMETVHVSVPAKAGIPIADAPEE